MKSIFTVLCTLLIFGLYAQEDHVCRDLSHIIEMEKLHGEKLMRQASAAQYGNYDVKYHRLEWNVDPAKSYIVGKVTTHFQTTEDDVSTIDMDLSSNMIVNAIAYHGQELSYELKSDDVLTISLGQSLSKGTLDSITVSYEGNPTSVGFGSFAVETHNNTPIMWTLSEPYGAKYWWPCKQDLVDKIDSIDTYITVPKGNKAASNGLLHEVIEQDSVDTYHWRHRYAIPAYLIAIAVTNYETFSDYVAMPDGDSLEILNYVYPEDKERLSNDFKKTVDFISLYNDLFGAYPFADEKYGHAQFGWGGGMEHQTMSFMGGSSFNLQAHELAHQWFGDKVTCGSWAEIWLNEGFATYLSAIAIEKLRSEEEFYGWREGVINYVNSQPNGSVYVTDTTSVGRIFSGRLSYNKAAFVLHMIRSRVGDEAFFTGCKNYLNDPRLAYGYARTADFRNHIEAVSGDQLEEFFEDWIYGQGYPRYTLQWQSADDSDRITMNLMQTTSHSAVDFFEMKVPVQFKGEGIDTTIVLDHNSNEQVFSLTGLAGVDEVIIDPQLTILTNDKVVERVNAVGDIDENIVSIAGNPFRNELALRIGESDVKISIYDIQGRVVYTNALSQDTSINTSDWNPGTYVVEVLSEKRRFTTKVIKQ